MGCAPVSDRSTMASLLCPSATLPSSSAQSPEPSGPLCCMRSHILIRLLFQSPRHPHRPAIPHMPHSSSITLKSLFSIRS